MNKNAAFFILIWLSCFPLAKSSCVAAFAAEFFHGLTAGEAIVYGLCTLSCQNFLKALLKKITKGNIALMVKAAGHHSAVTEHPHLIAQTVAEAAITSVLGRHIRPVKLVSGFEPYPFTKAAASPAFTPGLGKDFFDKAFNSVVPRIKPIVVP